MNSPIPSDLLDWAQAQSECCELCPRQCRVNRLAGERGWCGAGPRPEYFMEYVHGAEEAELSPSHTVFLTGCNLACQFCHTRTDRQRRAAVRLTPERLQRLVHRGRREGARNLNVLGGDPMVNLPGLLELLHHTPESSPFICNTNLYCSRDALAAALRVAAVILADLKFGNADCAGKLCGAADYPEVVQARLTECNALAPDKLIIRHLVLPGHFECCTRPALEWLAAALPRARLSLKTEYLVTRTVAADSGLKRFLSDAEADAARDLARTLNLVLVPSATLNPDTAWQGSPPHSSLEIELVISPEGTLYLHHPNRDAIRLADAIAHPRETTDA